MVEETIDIKDLDKALSFIKEIQALCIKYQFELDGSGDYGLVISKYTDGHYHPENQIMSEVWTINPQEIDMEG